MKSTPASATPAPFIRSSEFMKTIISLAAARVLQRDTDVEPGTARQLRVDRDLASEIAYPLAHADEPESTLALDLPGVEPTPVIDDPQGDRVRGPTQHDLGLLGAAVLDGVSQPLLRDAIEHTAVSGEIAGI